jgi:hypothetical protein
LFSNAVAATGWSILRSKVACSSSLIAWLLVAGSRHILLLDPHEGEVEAHVELEGKPHEARLQLLRRKFDVPSSEVACGDQVAYGRLVDEELGVQRALLNRSVGLERQVEEPIVSSTRLAYRCLHGNIT